MWRAIATFGAACFAVRLVLFFVMHLVKSPYNFINHSLNDYNKRKTRRIRTIMTFVTAAGWTALAVALWFGMPFWVETPLLALFFALLAIINVATPFFIPKNDAQPKLWRTVVNYVLMIAGAVLSFLLMPTFVKLFKQIAPSMAGLFTLMHWVALIGLIAMIVSLIPKLRSISLGVSERIFFLAVTLFYIGTGLMMLQH